MKQKFIFKYILLFLLFIFLHYIEGLPPIFGLSVAQFWKLPLLFFLIIYNICYVYRWFAFEKYLAFFVLVKFLGKQFFSNFKNVFISGLRELQLVLFFNFFKIKFKDKKILEVILFSFVQYISLACLLDLLDIVNPLKVIYASSYGIENLSYFSSFFGKPHSASILFAYACFVYIWGFRFKKFKTKQSKIYNGFLFIVALIALFKAYIRTGWLIFLLGLFCFFKIEKLTIKQIFTGVFVLFFIITGLFYLYNNNKAFQYRISGRNVYSNRNAEGVDLEGSGRLDFWKNGILVWWNSSVYELFFGVGEQRVKDFNYEKTSMRVGSHSQFVDALSQYGLFAFIFLLLYYYYLYKFIRKRRNEYQSLSYALLLGSFIFSVFQSIIPFNCAILFALVLSLQSKDRIANDKLAFYR